MLSSWRKPPDECYLKIPWFKSVQTHKASSKCQSTDNKTGHEEFHYMKRFQMGKKYEEKKKIIIHNLETNNPTTKAQLYKATVNSKYIWRFIQGFIQVFS